LYTIQWEIGMTTNKQYLSVFDVVTKKIVLLSSFLTT